MPAGSKASGADAPGGNIVLQAQAGSLSVDQGATLDVSAGQQGDAGSITLNAPSSSLLLAGTRTGSAQNGGLGGSLFIDTKDLTGVTDPGSAGGFSSLNAKLGAGGFNNTVNVRVRSGDVTIEADQKVSTHNFTLSADSGNLDVYGSIDASGQNGGDGGSIELDAGKNLTVYAGSLLDVHGFNGGTVTLGSAVEVNPTALDSYVNFYGTINAASAPGNRGG